MEYTEQVARIAELGEKFRIIGGAVDQTGVGEAVIEDLRAEIRAMEGSSSLRRRNLISQVDCAGAWNTRYWFYQTTRNSLRNQIPCTIGLETREN
jgi:hypothetical protein